MISTSETSKNKAPKRRISDSLRTRRIRRLGSAVDRADTKENHRSADLAVVAASPQGPLPEPNIYPERPGCGQYAWLIGLVAVLSGLVLASMADLSGLSTDTISDFVDSYSNQYNVIIHERPGYCERHARLGAMVDHAWDQVLNQPDALEKLELALDNTTFNAIALIGSSGVGKSHTARLLREKFPWPENVKTVAWDDSNALALIPSILSHLKLCGRNLILVDNMTPKDIRYVPYINGLIRTHPEIANGTANKPSKKYVTIVYIISLNRLLPDDEFQAQKMAVQKLINTHLINYNDLERSHVEDCIRRTARVEGMELTRDQILDIIYSIDYINAGCKPVRAKVLMYGTPVKQKP
ncbi:uncharacterized protein [Drosophila bipectinata]|uniref:uncharacterized protein n=1 Tax=Drosophila bipectinata TaxID=42026 RepID=UPI001C8AC7AA|nr:uncharacterized protein LOC108123767 [Drosophila bipectinata]XP_017094555.2 uncharacterized protein LOC108123767 [Drosophila bipectinata]